MRIASFFFAYTLGMAFSFAGDSRFGFIGEGERAFAHTFNTNSYVLYANQNDPARPQAIQALEPANDPRPGDKIVMRVGLFNARKDGYGQTLDQFANSIKEFGIARAMCYANPLCFYKPRYTWFEPQVGNVPSDEKLQIITAIRRWKARGIPSSAITFEVGNEPNYFVSMTPGEYAHLYRQYYRFLKAEDPDIQVAMGTLFAFELMPEDARDQVATLIALRGEHETSARLDPMVDPLQDPRLFLFSLSGAAQLNIIGRGLGAWGSYAGRRATRDVNNLLFSRFFDRTSTQYLTEVLRALPEDIAPDIVTFHAYPADFGHRMSYEAINTITDNLARDLRDAAYAMRPSFYPPGFCSGDLCDLARGPKIWLTEVGNVNPYLNEMDVMLRMYHNLFHLANEGSPVSRWFWYKPVGRDIQFDMVKGITGIKAPLTRLVWDPEYGTPQKLLPIFPNKVPFQELNIVGTYLYSVSLNGHRLPPSAYTGGVPVPRRPRKSYPYAAML